MTAIRGGTTGTSGWYTVDQARIDAFAEATDDPQFIHADPERAARETPFGGTIAHGFLTASLLPAMKTDAMAVADDVEMTINYGTNRLRFVSPVPSGSRVRGHFSVQSTDDSVPGQRTVVFDVSVEIEGQVKPALVAEWIARYVLKSAD